MRRGDPYQLFSNLDFYGPPWGQYINFYIPLPPPCKHSQTGAMRPLAQLITYSGFSPTHVASLAPSSTVNTTNQSSLLSSASMPTLRAAYASHTGKWEGNSSTRSTQPTLLHYWKSIQIGLIYLF